MNYCSSCGIQIPNDQRSCSMCYGDPYHGHDGYYLHLMEEEAGRAALDAQIQDLWSEVWQEFFEEWQELAAAQNDKVKHEAA